MYEILNDNIDMQQANVYDDIHASYMTKNDYVRLTRIEQMNIEEDNPTQDLSKLKEKNEEEDKGFETILEHANNFKMDWTQTKYDEQSPHINEYEYSFGEIAKDRDNRLNPDNKYEDGWKDVKQKTYDRPDYGTSSLFTGDAYTGCSYNNGQETSCFDFFELEGLRGKLVAYAKEACQLAKDSSLFRYAHKKVVDQVGKANALKKPSDLVKANGNKPIYLDCSEFTRYLYAAASDGKLNIGGCTSALAGDTSNFEMLYKGEGLLTGGKKAYPGDLILGNGHVAMYIGNEQIAHSSTDERASNDQVRIAPLSHVGGYQCVLRHKTLLDPPKQSSTIKYVNIDCSTTQYANSFNYSPSKKNVYYRGSYSVSKSTCESYINQRFAESSANLQFLDLSASYNNKNMSAEAIQSFFKSKGHNLSQTEAQAFITAGEKTGINPCFFVAMMASETAWGTSRMYNGISTTGIYNAYGIGASDIAPTAGSAVQGKLYDFTSKAKGIINGAVWIKDKYIKSSAHGYQKTLYFMKWDLGNHISGVTGASPNSHSYCTDIEMPVVRAQCMYEALCMQPGGFKEQSKGFRYVVPKFTNQK